jgi:hypothetical protein
VPETESIFLDFRVHGNDKRPMMQLGAAYTKDNILRRGIPAGRPLDNAQSKIGI